MKIIEVPLLPQIGEQVEHLRLHRNVERRDRLVGDDDIGRRQDRARDADPLALTAAQFVRDNERRKSRSRPTSISAFSICRCRSAVLSNRPWISPASATESPIERRGIERRKGVLKYHSDFQPQLSQVVGLGGENVLAIE